MLDKLQAYYVEIELNNSILSILQAGTSIDDESVVALRTALKTLGLKETYNFESYREVI